MRNWDGSDTARPFSGQQSFSQGSGGFSHLCDSSSEVRGRSILTADYADDADGRGEARFPLFPLSVYIRVIRG